MTTESGGLIHTHSVGIPGAPSSGKITLTANSNDDKVLCYDHSHNFKNLAMDLYSTNEKVRTIVAKKCEGTDRVPPEGRSTARAAAKVDERES